MLCSAEIVSSSCILLTLLQYFVAFQSSFIRGLQLDLNFLRGNDHDAIFPFFRRR